MDGRNCRGRTISLLNDSSVVQQPQSQQYPFYPTKIQLPPLTAHSQSHSYSRASSCASSPSPQTPQLVRSGSSDSRGFASPSPLTPSSNSFDNIINPHSDASHRQHYYLQNPIHRDAKMDDQTGSMYPPIPDATGLLPVYPMPTQIVPQMPSLSTQQTYRSSNSPASEPSRVSTVSTTSNPKAQPKKNQYPCPMAKQYNCTDFFTTSGHAARHAKKHTGKKDAYCPECNKAFTRKDNMEQHRRTHQTGRASAKSSGTEDSKIKKTTKQPAKKAAIKVEPALEAALEQQLAEQQIADPIVEQQTQQPLQPALPAQVMPITQAQLVATQQALVEQAMLLPPGGPYFLSGADVGPIPALPMAMPELNVRPTLQRSNFTNSLDYVAPTAPLLLDPTDAMHYSYPSPGLSNGLNSLALAASKHRRLSEEKLPAQSPTQVGSPGQETPLDETPEKEAP